MKPYPITYPPGSTEVRNIVARRAVANLVRARKLNAWIDKEAVASCKKYPGETRADFDVWADHAEHLRASAENVLVKLIQGWAGISEPFTELKPGYEPCTLELDGTLYTVACADEGGKFTAPRLIETKYNHHVSCQDDV